MTKRLAISVLSKLTKPLHDLGKYCLDMDHREKYCFEVLSIILHILHNDIHTDGYDVYYFGRDGVTTSFTKPLGYLDVMYRHISTFRLHFTVPGL